MAQYVQKIGGQAVDLATTGFKTLQEAANAGYNPVAAPNTTPVTPTPTPTVAPPTTPVTPVTPIAPITPPTEEKTYIVQPGDTLAKIAQKYGVNPQDISGYRSGNPSVIFPKEVLRIGAVTQAHAQVGQSATQPIKPVPGAVSSPTSGAKATLYGPDGQKKVVDVGSGEAASLQGQGWGLTEGSYKAPEEAEEAEASQEEAPTIELSPEEQTLNDLLTQYNTSFSESAFALNPTGSIKDLVSQIMDVTGLPEVKAQITDITKQIEALNNERDAKIAEVNDNPWLSESLRAGKVNKITTEYENKTNNRINQLNLLQDLYDDARQQAEFAATKALDVYDRQREFDQQKLEFLIDRAEKSLEAKTKAQAEATKNDPKAKLDAEMTKKGYSYVATPLLRDQLKAQGYDIVVTPEGRTYAKPGATSTYKGQIINKNTGLPVGNTSTNKGNNNSNSNTNTNKITKEEKEFQTILNKQRDNLAKGGSWAIAWDTIKNRYPDISNDTLDKLLNKEKYYTQKGTSNKNNKNNLFQPS